jgi:ribose transport system substrate-binding protein
MLGQGKLSLLATSAIALALSTAAVHADDYLEKAKAYIAEIAKPGAPWTGPTTGPVAQGHKKIIFVDDDERNSGSRGVGEGVADAAKIMGWDFRVIDGQGTMQGQTTAINQAIALKPDGIIIASVDALEHNPEITQAVDLGIKVVSWHSGAVAGKIPGSPIITNVTTEPADIAHAAGLFVVADSNGTANAVLIVDTAYQIAVRKTEAEKVAIEGCKTCKVLSVENVPFSDISTRMPPLTTALKAKYGNKWTYTIAINDLYFDYMAPELQAEGVPGGGPPQNISSGDGSESAFQRIETGQYQVGTVAEPLRLHGFQCIDELNRAFAGQAPSGYLVPVHLFTPQNVKFDRGKGGIYDPSNGYEQVYRKIWNK